MISKLQLREGDWMSVAFDWRVSAEKLRFLAAESADKELVDSLHRLACEYETKATAHDFLSKAYVTQPPSKQSENVIFERHG